MDRGPGPGGERRGSRIHRGLTGERALVGTRYLADPALRREYAAEIAPRTGAALAKILAGLQLPAPRRVLDLGAGTGAVAATLRAAFGEGPEIVQVDRVAARGLVTADLERALPPVEGRFDLVVAAHLLGELFVEAAAPARLEARTERVLTWCRRFLAEGGTALLIEPALRETSRELLAVRDRLVAGGLRVVAPCFWTGPCPALERPRDWCHDAAPAGTPGAPRVDFSYLALRAAGSPDTDPTLFRIVSDPLPEKGRLRIFGCGPAGRHPLVRLDRHASPSNVAFDELARGDVATVAATRSAPDGLRLTPETVVRRRGS
jgi:SAM-dependent methyltransferase